MRTDDLITLLAKDAATLPLRPATDLMRWLPLAVFATGGVLLGTLGLRPNLSSSAVFMPTVVKVMFGVLLAALAGYGALHLTRPESKAGMPVAILATTAGIFVITILLRDGSWLTGAAARWPSVLRCLTFVPLLAAMPLAAFIFAMKQGAVTQPRVAGAMAGVASAGLAIVVYGLNCTEDSPLFLALWYSAATMVTAMIGAVTARRVLVW